ncbi:MAG: hypothetical protein KAK00_11110 [Nanoarchaeota archaeon]|nr:hypothetical protein [Nanoarchaeota archaeon]
MPRSSDELKADKVQGNDEIVLKKGGARCIEMTNGSGSAVARGDLVLIKTSAGNAKHFTTDTGGDSDQVIGMAYERIADGAKGLIQEYGPTNALKVDGTIDVSVGDFISTFTSAGIGQKGTIGSGNCMAIACEAYATNDSLGVIDAFLLGSAR